MTILKQCYKQCLKQQTAVDCAAAFLVRDYFVPVSHFWHYLNFLKNSFTFCPVFTSDYQAEVGYACCSAAIVCLLRYAFVFVTMGFSWGMVETTDWQACIVSVLYAYYFESICWVRQFGFGEGGGVMTWWKGYMGQLRTTVFKHSNIFFFYLVLLLPCFKPVPCCSFLSICS